MNRISIYWLSQAGLLVAIAVYGRFHHSDGFNIIGALLSLLVMCLAASIGTFGFWLATKIIKASLSTKAIIYLAAFPAIMSNVAGNLASDHGPEAAAVVAVTALFIFSFLVGWKHEVYVPKFLRG
jgi:hypothetical protein